MSCRGSSLTLIQAILAALSLGVIQAAPLRTDFPYQGRLADGGPGGNGLYDFRLLLFDGVTGGHQVGSALVQEDVLVTNGSFNLNLDFGPAILTPQPLWLEVSVRRGGSANGYTPLTPRQPVTPVPLALFSTAAGALLGPSVTASNLTAGAVGTVHIQNAAVTGDKIAAGQVVRSLNSIRDDVVLQGGPSIQVAQAGNTVTIGLDSVTLGTPKSVVVISTNGVSASYPTLVSALAAVQDGEKIEVYASQTVVAQKVGPGIQPELAGLYLTNHNGVTINGVGSPSIRSATQGDFLYIRDCTNITVSGLAFDGPGSNPAEADLYCMINFGGTNRNLTVRNCRFTNFGDQGIAHLYGDKTSTFVTVEGCYFYNGGTAQQPQQGVDGAAVAGIGSGWTVIHNRIENCARGIEIEGSGPSRQSNIIIAHNILSDIWNEGICLFGTSLVSSNYTDIVVEGNLVSGKAELPPGVLAQAGIDFQGGERITIANNVVSDMPSALFGIGANSGWTDLRDSVITGNIVRNIGGRGIQLARAFANPVESCVVSANHVQACGDRGIIVSGTKHLITGNISHSNQGAGIEVYVETATTDRNTISGNVCYNNTYGIAVMTNATNTLLSANNCFDNSLGQTYLPQSQPKPPQEGAESPTGTRP